MSRIKRWNHLTGKARKIVDEIEDLIEKLDGPVTDLGALQEEYEEWRANLPEGLAYSATGEKLEEVCDIAVSEIHEALQNGLADAVSALEEAEEIELPRGFGRD